jgi:hypothetical protein
MGRQHARLLPRITKATRFVLPMSHPARRREGAGTNGELRCGHRYCSQSTQLSPDSVPPHEPVHHHRRRADVHLLGRSRHHRDQPASDPRPQFLNLDCPHDGRRPHRLPAAEPPLASCDQTHGRIAARGRVGDERLSHPYEGFLASLLGGSFGVRPSQRRELKFTGAAAGATRPTASACRGSEWIRTRSTPALAVDRGDRRPRWRIPDATGLAPNAGRSWIVGRRPLPQLHSPTCRHQPGSRRRLASCPVDEPPTGAAARRGSRRPKRKVESVHARRSVSPPLGGRVTTGGAGFGCPLGIKDLRRSRIARRKRARGRGNAGDQPAKLVNIHHPAQRFESFTGTCTRLIYAGKIKDLPPRGAPFRHLRRDVVRQVPG